MKKVLINCENREVRVAILEDEQLTELYIESLDNKTILNNIYKGRIEGVIPGLKAAFVNIGLERNAFLHFDDIRPDILLDFHNRRNPESATEEGQAEAARPADHGVEPPVEQVTDYQPSEEELLALAQLSDAETPVAEEAPAAAEGPAAEDDTGEDGDGSRRKRRRRGRRGGKRRHRDGEFAQGEEQEHADDEGGDDSDDDDQPHDDQQPRQEQEQPRHDRQPRRDGDQPRRDGDQQRRGGDQQQRGGDQQQRGKKRRNKNRDRGERGERQPQPPQGQQWVPAPTRGVPGSTYGTRAASNPFDVFSPYAQQPLTRRDRKQRRVKGAWTPPVAPGQEPVGRTRDGRESQEDFFGPVRRQHHAPPVHEAEDNDDQTRFFGRVRAQHNTVHDVDDEHDDGPAPGNEKFPTVSEPQRSGRSGGQRSGRRKRSGRSMKRRGPSGYAARRKVTDEEAAAQQDDAAPKKTTKAAAKAKVPKGKAAGDVQEWIVFPGEEDAAKTKRATSRTKKAAGEATEDAPVAAKPRAARAKKAETAPEPVQSAETPAAKPARASRAKAAKEPAKAEAASDAKPAEEPKRKATRTRKAAAEAAPVEVEPEKTESRPARATRRKTKAEEESRPAEESVTTAPASVEAEQAAEPAKPRRRTTATGRTKAAKEASDETPAATAPAAPAPVEGVPSATEAAPSHDESRAESAERSDTAAEGDQAPARRRRRGTRGGARRSGRRSGEHADAPAHADTATAEPAAEADAEAMQPATATGQPPVQEEAPSTPPSETGGDEQDDRRVGRRERWKMDREKRRAEREQRRGDRRGARVEQRRNLPAVTTALRKGDEIMVQVIKEEIGLKGARISSHISMPGRYLVFLPYSGDSSGGVSRKVEDHAERKRLKTILRDIHGEIDMEHAGFIIRTAGIDRSEEEIRSDVEFLTGEWKEVMRRNATAKATECVHDDSNILKRLARDVFDDTIGEIIIDSEQEAEKLRDVLRTLIPSLVEKVTVYTDSENVFSRYGVEKQIQKAARRKVWLKSGGYLIIDEAEALTAIDVNTGKFIGKDDQEKMILKTNLEASRAIARELRLRDIGGLIVIDFIDMRDHRNKEQLLNEFRACLKKDRSKTSVSSISEFGLVEMTRKRVRRSLRKTIFMDCPYCQGSGSVLNEQQIWLHIKNDVVQILDGTGQHPSLNIICNPRIRAYIDQNCREVIESMKKRFGVDIRVSMSDVFHVENYAIERIARGGERGALPVVAEAE